MNNVFQVNRSTFLVSEESSFKKRWTYRPKSQPTNKTQRRLNAETRSEEPWETLSGWDRDPIPSDITVSIDIVGWVKKSYNAKRGEAVDHFLFPVFVTCPGINIGDLKASSLDDGYKENETTENDNTENEPKVDEATQVELESPSSSHLKEKIEIESVYSTSPISRRSSGEFWGKTACTSQVGGEHQPQIDGAKQTCEQHEGLQEGHKASIPVTDKGCGTENNRSVLKSKSAPTGRQGTRNRAERSVSSAAQSTINGAAGDSTKQTNLRKTRTVTKKVTLNPAPIEISYTEEGLFEIGNALRDESPLEQLSVEMNDERSAHRISLRPPDRKAWEQNLKLGTGFELPMLSALSVGDLLASTPRLEQYLDNQDSKLGFIEKLYDKTPASSTDSIGSVGNVDAGEKKSLPNLPSLKPSETSPPHLVSSERRSSFNLNSTSETRASLRSTNSGQNSPNLERRSAHRSSRGDSLEYVIAQQRGPPAFRPQSNKTPLQRAMENAHKKIYGDHYYLFSTQNPQSGQVEVVQCSKDIRQTKSAHSNKTTNAQIWKERLDRNIKQQQSMLARKKKLQLKAGKEKYYTMSDFQAPLERTNILRTQRGRISQRY